MRASEIAAFCMQVSFLLGAGIPIDGGLAIMAEDAENKGQKDMLQRMADHVELGNSLCSALEQEGDFPDYVVKMAKVGQETGTLEQVMMSLSDYYNKESYLAQTIKNAVTYPIIMIFMLVLVLFVLLTKVMPVFESVYRQLGAEFSQVTHTAVKVGSVLSGAVLILIGVIGVAALWAVISAKAGHRLQWTEHLLGLFKEKSRIAIALNKRRMAAIMSVAASSGLDTNKGIDMSIELISQKQIREKLLKCRESLELGYSVFDALKATEIFTGIDLQMIKVGSRSGKLDAVFGEIALKYENEVDNTIENMIARFEPTVVVILAIAVGLILLSVMMPLVGIMASIG